MAESSGIPSLPRPIRVRGARAREARAALASMGVDKFRRFMDYLGKHGGATAAAEIFVEELAAGRSVEELLFFDQEPLLGRRGGGFNLSAEQRAADTWQIDFSCTPAPGLGDGALYHVRFGDGGEVKSVEISDWRIY